MYIKTHIYIYTHRMQYFWKYTYIYIYTHKLTNQPLPKQWVSPLPTHSAGVTSHQELRLRRGGFTEIPPQNFRCFSGAEDFDGVFVGGFTIW